jgi:hypothetical protein
LLFVNDLPARWAAEAEFCGDLGAPELTRLLEEGGAEFVDAVDDEWQRTEFTATAIAARAGA